MNIYKFQQISINFNKFLRISLIIIILFIGIIFLFSQKNFSIPQPTIKAQSSYPQCQQGKITSPCQCGNKVYNAGFCCYHHNANSGIWFDPSYDSCPTGNFYFVDQNNPQASDENPGTEDLPWKTINHAAEVLQAGDTVLVRGGVYNVGSSPSWSTPAVTPSNSGTPGNPITFKAYPGNQVTITTSGGQAAIGSNGKNYIVWDGFTVEMFGRMKGILLMNTKGCIIQNCTVIGDYIDTTDNHDGIRVEASEDTIVRNCIIHGVKGDSWNSSGIKCYNVTDLIVENCEIYDCYTGIFDKEEGRYNVYRKNIIHDIGPGPSILLHTQGGLSTEGIEINQNIIYNSPKICFACSHPMEHKNVKIYNNAFYDVAIDSKRSPNLQIWNNIFYNTDFSIIARINGTPTYSNFNCFYPTAKFETGRYTDNDVIYNSLSEWQNGTNLDLNSLNQDPLFVNPTSHNFHLQPSSSCLNAGIDRQDYDNDGNTTESINMGAYITGNETIGLIDLTQYIVEDSQPTTCASQNGVCCNENQICQNGTFISSSDCGNLCCTGECVSPSILGDLNQDNKVNSLDFQILIQKFKETQNIEIEDLNSDGIVDVKDIGILMHYWNP